MLHCNHSTDFKTQASKQIVKTACILSESGLKTLGRADKETHQAFPHRQASPFALLLSQGERWHYQTLKREVKTKLCATEKTQAGENRNGNNRNQKWKQKMEGKKKKKDRNGSNSQY